MIYTHKKKILALRIFTIKVQDADLFAIHACLYGKAFRSAPYRLEEGITILIYHRNITIFPVYDRAQ